MCPQRKHVSISLFKPIIVIFIVIVAMSTVGWKLKSYKERLIRDSYMQDIEVNYTKPCEYLWKTNPSLDTGGIDEVQLEIAAQLKYTGTSGIEYSFGVDGAKPMIGGDDTATIALNPKAYTTRRVGFYFMPTGSSHIANTSSALSLTVLQRAKQAAFFVLNEECGEITVFESNQRPNCSITFERSTHFVFEDNSWNCFVLTFDLDTHEVLDAFELVIEEFDEDGKTVEPIMTNLEGWWKLTGATPYKQPDDFGIDLVTAAINQHNASFSQKQAEDNSDIIDYFGVDRLPIPDSAIVHQIRSKPYASAMLTWSNYHNTVIPAINAVNRMIAITPKWNLANSKWSSVGKVPLITLYGYIDAIPNGGSKFVYVGYSQFEDSRCYDEVPYYVVAGDVLLQE